MKLRAFCLHVSCGESWVDGSKAGPLAGLVGVRFSESGISLLSLAQASWKLNPVQTMWVEMWIETAKALPEKTPELEARIEFYEAWIKRLEDIDPWTKEMRASIRKFALEGDDTVMRTLAKKE